MVIYKTFFKLYNSEFKKKDIPKKNFYHTLYYNIKQHMTHLICQKVGIGFSGKQNEHLPEPKADCLTQWKSILLNPYTAFFPATMAVFLHSSLDVDSKDCRNSLFSIQQAILSTWWLKSFCSHSLLSISTTWISPYCFPNRYVCVIPKWSSWFLGNVFIRSKIIHYPGLCFLLSHE